MDWIGNYIEQMPTIPNFYLQDTSGQVWQLGATALDAYTTTPVTNPSGAASFLLQDSGTSQTWAMTVLTNGALHISPSPGLGQQYIPVISSTGLLVGIGVTNAAIVVMALCPDMPIVGTFFNPKNYLPPFTQPGGRGTVTFPQEQTGELLGQWMLGCGHSISRNLGGSWCLKLRRASRLNSVPTMFLSAKSYQSVLGYLTSTQMRFVPVGK